VLDALSRPKIRDVVAARLRTFIVDERLKPGDRLPTETALAEQFGVSRLSLREATKALEFLGVVESKPGRGLSVGRMNFDRLTQYVEFHPELHDAPPRQLIQTRIVIETGVLPYVIERMRCDQAVFAALDEINGRLRKARDLKHWITHDIAFHRQLVESSGLAPLLAMNDLLAAFFRRFRESVKRAEWQDGIESHQRLIDLLHNGDLPAAGDELRTHIESHLKRMPATR